MILMVTPLEIGFDAMHFTTLQFPAVCRGSWVFRCGKNPYPFFLMVMNQEKKHYDFWIFLDMFACSIGKCPSHWLVRSIAKREAREPGCLSLLSLVDPTVIDTWLCNFGSDSSLTSQWIPPSPHESSFRVRAGLPHLESRNVKKLNRWGIRLKVQDFLQRFCAFLCYLCLAAYHFAFISHLSAVDSWVMLSHAESQFFQLISSSLIFMSVQLCCFFSRLSQHQST